MSDARPTRTVLAAAGGYVLVVFLMALPASLHLSQRLIGNNIDNWIFYWNNWWVGRAIAEGHSWFHSPYMFYPQGANLIAHSHSFLNSLLALAIEPLAGPVAAYNLVFLFGLWIGALGMFLLVREVTDQSWAAFLAGFIFAFAPYHLSQALAHLHLGSIHWWPFYALFLRRTLHHHRPTDALVAGLFAALTFWSGFQLAVLLALWTVLYVVWHLLHRTSQPAEHSHRRLREIGLVGLTGVVALALCAPLVIPLARESRQLAEAAQFDEGTQGQTDLLAYLLPPTYHPLAGRHVVSSYERFEANRVAMPYLGYTALGLALVALRSHRRKSAFWLVGAMLWIVLAAGQAPRFNGVSYEHIPLPYRLVKHLFPISTLRASDRFNLLTTLSLAVLAGLGAAHLAKKRRWLLIPVALLAAFEYLCAPLPAWDLPPGSAFFERMAQDEAQDEAQYGVLDLPMGYTSSKLWLYYQTLHGKPLVEGHISRYQPADYGFITANPLLRALYPIGKWPVRLPEELFAGGPEASGPAWHALRTSGVRYILLHKPYLDAAGRDRTYLQNLLPIVPVYEDATLAAYDVTHPFPVYYDSFPIPLTHEITLARFDVHPTDGGKAWRIQAVVRLFDPQSPPLTCHVDLIEGDRAILTSPVTFFEDLPEVQWEDGDLDVKETRFSLDQELQPGRYHWAITCAGIQAYASPETLDVHADGHTTYLRRTVNTSYGDGIQLAGYRWRTEGADLQVTLRWAALQEPREDYKIFVHLLDSAPDGAPSGVGEIVQQYDAMPCQWQCPTSQWQAGEIILDRATLSLAQLPPGEYHLAVGVYSPETEERLPARAPEGELYPDARFVLPDVLPIRKPDPENR